MQLCAMFDTLSLIMCHVLPGLVETLDMELVETCVINQCAYLVADLNIYSDWLMVTKANTELFVSLLACLLSSRGVLDLQWHATLSCLALQLSHHLHVETSVLLKYIDTYGGVFQSLNQIGLQHYIINYVSETVGLVKDFQIS